MFYNFVRTPAIVKTGMGILGKIDELLHTSHLHFPQKVLITQKHLYDIYRESLLRNEFCDIIFVEGGNIVQQFSEGTYELTTNNYPFISRLKNALSGGISTFHCVIYFFKNADSMELKWGADDPIQVRDKVYGIRTSVQARGSYKVRIENPALFLEKLIGNNVRGLNQNELNKYFKNEM